MKYLQLSVNPAKPFVIVESRDATGWGWATHPFLSRVSDDTLVVTYWLAGDGAMSGTAPVDWPVYSPDNGITWESGNPLIWANDPYVSFPLELHKGDVFTDFTKGIFFSSTAWPNGARALYTLHARRRAAPYSGSWSEDGEIWSAPEEVTVHFPPEMRPMDYLVFDSPSVVTSSGVVLTLGWGKFNRTDKLSTYLFESTDGGKTRHYVSTIATPEDTYRRGIRNEGPNESALLALSDDELICVSRVGSESGGPQSGTSHAAPLILGRSVDRGITWDIELLGIRGVMPKLLEMSNGVLVLATGRPANRLYFSTDKGRTWGRELAISKNHQPTTGYCDLVEAEPGRLLVVYDLIETTEQRFWLWEPTRVNRIMGRFVDVNWRIKQ